MSEKIDAFRHYKDSMGQSGWCPIVFIHKETAELEAEDKKEEWTSYQVHPVKVRVLNEQEGAVGNDLVTINREEPDAIYKRRALRKLTPRERQALKLP